MQLAAEQADQLLADMQGHWKRCKPCADGLQSLHICSCTCSSLACLTSLWLLAAQAVYHMPTSEDAEPASSMPLALQSVFYKACASCEEAALHLDTPLLRHGSIHAAGAACRWNLASPSQHLFYPLWLTTTLFPALLFCLPIAAPVHGRPGVHQGPHPLLWLGHRRRLPAARRAGAQPHPVRPAGGEDEGEGARHALGR